MFKLVIVQSTVLRLLSNYNKNILITRSSRLQSESNYSSRSSLLVDVQLRERSNHPFSFRGRKEKHKIFDSMFFLKRCGIAERFTVKWP